MGGKGSGGRRRGQKKRKAEPLATDRKAFERMPRETDPAWFAFKKYRDMEKRSLIKLGKSLGKSRALVEGWSSKWRWRERVVAWDRAADDRARAASLDEIEEMQRRHIKLGQGMQQLGALELKRLLGEYAKKAAAGEAGGVGLTPRDVKRLIDAGARLERLNRGEPGSIEKIDVDVVAERRELIRATVADPKVRAFAQAVHDRLRSGNGSNGNASGRDDDGEGKPAH
jgi:hypothetical protein